MATEKLQFIIEAVNNTEKTLKDIQTQLGKMSDATKNVADQTKKLEKGNDTYKRLTKTVLTLGAAYKTFEFLREAVQLHQETESAMFRLATITNNATGATQAQVEALFQQAEALEKIGVIDKTTILNGQAKLATFDLQTKSIQELTPRLLDLVVGEYGLSASSEQVANTANGVGKALQGNVELFTKQGFIVSEAQREMLKYGTEAERVATINDILGSTYDSLNEKATETAEGAMLNMQHRLEDIKEEIGKQVTPTIGLFIGELSKTMEHMDGTSTSFANLGEIIFRFANFVLGISKSVVQGIMTLTSALDIGITRIFNKGKAEEKAKVWAETLTESAKGIMENFNQFLTASKFDVPEFSFFGKKTPQDIIKPLAEISEEAQKKSEEIKSAFEKLGDGYKNLMDDAEESLINLSESHKENMSSMRNEIAKTRQEMTSLQDAYNKQKASDEMSIAEQIVANETRVADIQKELQTSVSTERQAELQLELDQRLLAMQSNAGFIQQFEQEIEEVKRRNALTDLERAIEDFNVKRQLAEQEFNAKMSALQAEISAIKQKEKEERAIYEEKRQFIIDAQEQAMKMQEETQAQSLTMTKDNIEKEIAYYKQLAEAIRAARSGNTGKFTQITKDFKSIGSESVNDAIISPYGKIITTHPDDYLIATKNPQSLGGSGSVTINITGNSFMGERDMAEKVGDQIIRKLKLSARLV